MDIYKKALLFDIDNNNNNKKKKKAICMSNSTGNRAIRD